MPNIGDAKQDLTGIVHSTSLDKITNLNSVFQRAARNLLGKLDPRGTVRIAQISDVIHDEIFNYSAPSDLKGNKVIDIRPQVNRGVQDNQSQRFAREFDHRKTTYTFQVRDDGGTKSLRISQPVNLKPVVLHSMNSITDNGTWAVGGDATNLTRDTVNRVSGSASLNFDLDGSGVTGHIEISDMNQVDLTDHDEKSELFVRVYIPDTSIITNFILRWGNSSAVYWSRTVTSPYDRDSFRVGWNTLKFSWNGAAETGTVDPSAIDYLRVTVTYDGTVETDLRVDKIDSSLGEIFEIEYYSKYLFRTSGGTWQGTTSSDTDIVNLDEDDYNIFLFECGLAIAQQMQGADSAFDRNYFKEELFGDPRNREEKPGLYKIYKTDHPSEARRPRGSYWRFNTYTK